VEELEGSKEIKGRKEGSNEDRFLLGCCVAVMTEAAGTPETSVNCQTIQPNIPEQSHLYYHCRENLNPHQQETRKDLKKKQMTAADAYRLVGY
jgi:hypothetical protein